MNKIKNILSFLHPIMVEARSGNITPYLEVMRSKGRYVLNSQSANYSFGGLHVVFDRLFQIIDIKQFDFKNILVLGMGAGSVISLLKEKYNVNCNITSIEKDQVVIDLARKYFDIDRHKSLKIINTDAFSYTKVTGVRYDLIISDLFIDNNVPQIFSSVEYLLNLKRIANPNACIIYNKMTEKAIHKKELIDLTEDFEQIFPGSVVHTLCVNDSENSLLYYNTLPIVSQSASLFRPIRLEAKSEWIPLNTSYIHGAN